MVGKPEWGSSIALAAVVLAAVVQSCGDSPLPPAPSEPPPTTVTEQSPTHEPDSNPTPQATPECPSVHVLDPSGGCFSEGVQGCADIFLTPEGTCRPLFERCAPGTIPVLNQGCVPVGIAGCAPDFVGADGLCRPTTEACGEGTIPHATEGCIPVGPPVCAEPFRTATGCRPSASQCPAGTLPDIAKGCLPVGIASCAPEHLDSRGVCRPTMTSCPPGTFATPAGGCPSEDGPAGCGDGPWGDPVAPGSALRVDASAVTADPDGSLERPFATVGEALAASKPGGTILVAAGTYDEGLHIQKPVHLIGRCPSLVRITGALATTTPFDATVWVDGAQGVTIRGLYLGGEGVGVALSAGTAAALQHLVVEGAHGAGILSVGANTTVSLEDSVIRGTVPATGSSVGGRGVNIEDGAHAVMTRCALFANREVGLFVSSNGSSVLASDCLIEGTLPVEETGTFGRGVVVQNGASATLEGNAIVGNHDVGVFVALPLTSLLSTRNLVEGTRARAADGTRGRGVVIGYGATATLFGDAVVNNREVGVFVSDYSTVAHVAGTLVRDTLPRLSDGLLGVGVSVEVQAHATFDHCALLGNHDAGFSVSDPGTNAELSGCLIEGTSPSGSAPDAGDGGFGILATAGGHVQVSDTTLLSNTTAGMLVMGFGTSADVSGSLVTSTLPSRGDGQLGIGVVGLGGATVSLSNTAIVGNHEAGIAVAEPLTRLTGTNLRVAGTLASAATGELGRGLDVEDGAVVELVGVVFSRNREAGVFASSEGTEVKLYGAIIEETLPQESDQRFGRAVAVQGGARLVLEGSALRLSRDVALFASGAGTTVESQGNLIEGTLPQKSDLVAGRGVQLQDGAQGLFVGDAVRDHYDLGVLALGNGTRLDAAEVLVEGTRPAAGSGLRGIGVLVAQGASAGLDQCAVGASSIAGVMAHGADLVLSASLLFGTRPGLATDALGRESADIGDGLMVLDGSTATVQSTQTTACERAGIVFDDSTGTVMATESHGNQFGIVLQGEARPEIVDDNVFDANSAEDVVEEGSLPVPADPLAPQGDEESSQREQSSVDHR